MITNLMALCSEYGYGVRHLDALRTGISRHLGQSLSLYLYIYIHLRIDICICRCRDIQIYINT